MKWLALGDADTLDRLLEDWIRSLRSRRRIDPASADELRRRLWTPIEAVVRDCKTVVLIPDGGLSRIPWAALPGRRTDSYLIEDYALAQAPYGQHVARLLTDSTPEGDGLLLVGGIDYGPHGKWNRLPGTAEEVQQLEQLRPGARTVRLEGEDATKARLQQLLPGRRYVHLATHGEFLDPGSRNDRARFRGVDSTSGGAVFDVTARNPLLLSMLILAGANRPVPTDARGLPVGSDSFLTAEEVMGMDLTRTELVVLSACETGLGKVRGSEGVFSLQRAFHISGSRGGGEPLANPGQGDSGIDAPLLRELVAKEDVETGGVARNPDLDVARRGEGAGPCSRLAEITRGNPGNQGGQSAALLLGRFRAVG